MIKNKSLKVSKSLNSSMKQKSLIIAVFLLTLLTLPLFSAEIQTLPTTKAGECLTLRQSHPNATSINITSIKYPNSSEVYDIIEMNSTNNINYFYEFCNSSQTGYYIVTTCGNGDGTLTCMDYNFYISPTGDDSSIQTSIVQLAFILAFILLGVGTHYLKKNVDFEKWNNSIINKYEHRNYIKLVLSSIAYNLIKNSFLVYYLIGLPIVVSLTDLAFYYGLTNMVNIFKVVTIIYTIGIIIVGLIFLGYVQEWLIKLLDTIKDMSWGIE